jgi:membrane-associated phospholipid phosphatase
VYIAKIIDKLKMKFLLIYFALTGHLLGQIIDTSARPVYRMNRLATIGITAGGAIASVAGTFAMQHKKVVTESEIAGLDPEAINGFDRWVLDQPIPDTNTFTRVSTIALSLTEVLPFVLFFDKSIQKDWINITLMLLETDAIALTIYECSPLGPLFQNKFRPMVYKKDFIHAPEEGEVRNSFFSGHTMAAAASSFFMAKVYSDYHPEANQFLLYGAACIPPLYMAYLRLRALEHFPSDVLVGFGVGAACGVIIPSLHLVPDNDVKIGIYTSPNSTGLRLNLALK